MQRSASVELVPPWPCRTLMAVIRTILSGAYLYHQMLWKILSIASWREYQRWCSLYIREYMWWCSLYIAWISAMMFAWHRGNILDNATLEYIFFKVGSSNPADAIQRIFWRLKAIFFVQQLGSNLVEENIGFQNAAFFSAIYLLYFIKKCFYIKVLVHLIFF